MKQLVIAAVLGFCVSLSGCESIPFIGDSIGEVKAKCEAADIAKTCQVAQAYGVLADLQERLNAQKKLNRIEQSDFDSRTAHIANAERIIDAADVGVGNMDGAQVIIDQLLLLLLELEAT